MSTWTPPIPGGCVWALFLDIDGTLLDLAETPEAVRVPPGLPECLHDLGRRLGGALALVSGRPLSDIDRLFPGGFDAAGTHGAQWRLGGIQELLAPGSGHQLTLAAAALGRHLTELPGVRLEPKPHALALHYRQAPERRAEVAALAEREALALGPAYRVQPGKAVVEILPAAIGKGVAIRRFMTRSPYAGRLPVFAGDDLTDEDGFAAVNELGGVSIGVGAGRDSQALYRLDAPADLRAWLAQVAAGLSAGQSSIPVPRRSGGGAA